MTQSASKPGKRKSSPELKLEITALCAKRHVDFISRNLHAAHKLLKPPLCEMSLAIVGNEKMAKLHDEFMDIPEPTDVLTFELDHDSRGRPVAGEVVICAPVALKQARTDGRPIEHELLLYALHGMLHLCGFDDRTAKAFKAMHAKEDELLSRLSIGPVFHAAPRRPVARAGSAR